MAQLNCKQSIHQSYGVGASQSRSSSQPTFFASHSLPPLSPLPQSEASLASSSSNKDASMDEVDVSSQGGPAIAYENAFRASFNSLPPRRGHRRSSSDVPLEFDVMIQTSPQLVPISGQGASGNTAYVNDRFGREMPINLKKEMNNVDGTFERRVGGEVVNDVLRSYMVSNGTERSGSELSDHKSESFSKRNVSGMDGSGPAEGNKRTAAEDIGHTGRHLRSLSVDSAFGNLHFSEESPKRTGAGNSLNESFAKFNMEFGNNEFSEGELKKIMADERLSEIAFSDPKRAKRVLANRQSAARSKERKLRYISELEHNVRTLQVEVNTLSSQLTKLQKEKTEVMNQNNELKFLLQDKEQQARLRDDLTEALKKEVQHLKLAAGEISEDDGSSSCIIQHLPSKHHMIQMTPQQQHRQFGQHQHLSGAASKNATTASASPTSA